MTRHFSSARAFDVLRQWLTAEESADVAGPKRAGGVVAHGEDAGVVPVLGMVRCGQLGGDPVDEDGDGDGLPDDRQVLKVGFRLSQPCLEFDDLGAEVIGDGPGRRVCLNAERVE
ncbi:hypothetical protein [Streptomyces sp. NPDC054771]